MYVVNMNIFIVWFVIHVYVYCINFYVLGVLWVYYELCILLIREMFCFGIDGV